MEHYNTLLAKHLMKGGDTPTPTPTPSGRTIENPNIKITIENLTSEGIYIEDIIGGLRVTIEDGKVANGDDVYISVGNEEEMVYMAVYDTDDEAYEIFFKEEILNYNLNDSETKNCSLYWESLYCVIDDPTKDAELFLQLQGGAD